MTTLELPEQPADQAALVEGGNGFAARIYREVSGQEGNVFVSPISISTAFGLLHVGAKGKTATEIADVMGYGGEEVDVAAGMGGLTSALKSSGAAGDLKIANGVYVDRGYELTETYQTSVRTDYGASVREMGFSTAPDSARKSINGEIERQTNNRIKDLLPDGFVTPETRLVLTDAVWFKADWATQFDPNFTRKGEFNTALGKTVPAELMNKEMQVRYLETAAFQAVDLPYKGDGFSLAVILPKQVDGIGALESAMTPRKLTDWLSKLDAADMADVDLTLPKVKTEASYDLAKPLFELGVRTAFTKEADLSGMNGTGGLMVSGVVHKTFLEINEKGTEAAAATGVGVMLTSARTPPPVTFTADHPFLLVLRHKATGAILFIGRVSEV